MSLFDAHANLCSALVVTAPSPDTSGTSLTVTAGSGALFPTAPFNCTVTPWNTFPTQSNAEIVRVTAVVGDTLTIVRAQESTTAKAIAPGWIIANTITVKDLTDIEDGQLFTSIKCSDIYLTAQSLLMLGANTGSAFNANIPGDTGNGDLTGTDGLGLLGQIKQKYTPAAWDSGMNLPNVFYVSAPPNADGTTNLQAFRMWAEVTGSNNSTNVIGVIGSGVNAGSGTASALSGVNGFTRIYGSGSGGTATGVGSAPIFRGAGNITVAFIGFGITAPVYAGGATGRVTGDVVGLLMPDMNSVNSCDEIYGVDIRDQTKGANTAASYRGRMASGTDKWNAYFDGTALNYSAAAWLIGATAQIGSEMLLAKQTASANYSARMWNSATSGDNAFVSFGTEGSYTERGSITYNRAGGLVAYNTTSDARIKKDFVVATDAPEIDNIRVGPYTLIETDTRMPYGVLAQELYNAYPPAVTPGDGSPLSGKVWFARKARQGARNERNIAKERLFRIAEDAFAKRLSELDADERSEDVAKIQAARAARALLQKPVRPVFEHDPEDDLPDPKLWAVDYSKLVPPLIAYAQASRRQIRAQEIRIKSLEDRILALEQKLT